METLKDTFLHSLQRGIRVVMGTSEEAGTSSFSMKSEELGSGISSFSMKSEELGSGIFSSSSMKSEELGSWCSSPTSTSLPDADAALETLDREFQNLVLNDTENAEAESAPKDSKSGRRSHHNNPLRPGEPDCAFFLRTGTCRYGSNCRFNHPPRRKNKVGNGKEMENEMDKEKEKARLGKTECKDNEMENEKEQKEKARLGKLECKYYQKSGGCKFGKACRYYHPREKAAEGEQLELNFLGLPIRPGEKECPFYMREGSCKFATNCRFHHPDPTAAGGCDPLIPLHVSTASQPPAPLWPSQRASIEPTSYIDASPPSIPIVTLPPQVVHPNPEWYGYQAPLASPLVPTDVWQPSGSVTVKADDSNHQQKTTVDGFPERPGQPDCQYFVKNGDCKFRSACRFHHPRTRASKSSTCLLSPMGLPLRPDQTICTHYSRHGICRFGGSCKFDHPINVSSAVPAPAAPPSLDSLVMSTTESGWQ